MGKIRAAVIGSDAEAEQKAKRERQREGKKAQEQHGKTQHHGGDQKTSESDNQTFRQSESSDTQSVPKKDKVIIKKKTTKRTRSSRYTESVKLSDRAKFYKIGDALDILSKMKPARFDETVELHITTIEKGVTGTVTLPHGTGKKTKVAIVSPSQFPTETEKLLKDIEAGKIEFDILVATPDAMPRLAKVARILGPRGLMPNPKNGTVTPKPQDVAKKYEGGQIAYKTEAKAPLIHVSVGKLSFGKEKLSQNIKTLLGTIDSEKVKSIFLKSTMSPSLKLEK